MKNNNKTKKQKHNFTSLFFKFFFIVFTDAPVSSVLRFCLLLSYFGQLYFALVLIMTILIIIINIILKKVRNI